MKRYILLTIMFLVVISTNAYAQTDAVAQPEKVTVMVDNYVIDSPVPAQLVNDRTMLPMRSIFERIGARVTWMEADKIIFATKGNLLITMQIDNTIMSVQQIENDEVKKIELDSPPFIKDGSTMVPVRAVAESLGCVVEWDSETFTANVITVMNGVK